MNSDPMKLIGSSIEFAGFGKGAFAYIRRVEQSEVYDELAAMEEQKGDAPLWGLFAADGEPLAVSDDQQAILLNAHELELLPVSRH